MINKCTYFLTSNAAPFDVFHSVYIFQTMNMTKHNPHYLQLHLAFHQASVVLEGLNVRSCKPSGSIFMIDSSEYLLVCRIGFHTYEHLVHDNPQGPAVASWPVTRLQKHFRRDIVRSSNRAVRQCSPVPLPTLGSSFTVHRTAASTPA